MRTYIGPEQLAAELGISLPTVYRMTKAGTLPHHRVGRQIRYDLDEVLASTRRETAAAR